MLVIFNFGALKTFTVYKNRQLRYMATPGLFIVFEGLDRSGKTTQSKMAVDALRARNMPAEYMRFPDRNTPTGELITAMLSRNEGAIVTHDDYLAQQRTMQLLFVANRWEVIGRICALLRDGVTVICDRYIYSGIAYGIAAGLEMEWCLAINGLLPKPDRVIFLDISPEKAAKRTEFGGEIYETLAFQRAVQAAYSELRNVRWVEFDADTSETELHAKIMHTISPI